MNCLDGSLNFEPILNITFDCLEANLTLLITGNTPQDVFGLQLSDFFTWTGLVDITAPTSIQYDFGSNTINNLFQSLEMIVSFKGTDVFNTGISYSVDLLLGESLLNEIQKLVDTFCDDYGQEVNQFAPLTENIPVIGKSVTQLIMGSDDELLGDLLCIPKTAFVAYLESCDQYSNCTVTALIVAFREAFMSNSLIASLPPLKPNTGVLLSSDEVAVKVTGELSWDSSTINFGVKIDGSVSVELLPDFSQISDIIQAIDFDGSVYANVSNRDDNFIGLQLIVIIDCTKH